jgi:ATP-dependent exoDNAse (exonuclease V) beta subunit
MEGIRILSIHKSKGLEFHTVLVPFCDWKMENETMNQLVWCGTDEVPYNMLDIVPVNYSGAMGQSAFREAYLTERLQLWVDNLNLLYVSFTRAAKNLLIFGNNAPRGLTAATLLKETLPEIADSLHVDWDVDSPIFSYGTVAPSASSSRQGTSNNRLLTPPVSLPVRMRSIRPNVMFKQSHRSQDFIRAKDETTSAFRFIDRGKLLHQLFAHINTRQDVDSAIERLFFEGVIGTENTKEELRALAESAFTLPEVQDWYSGKWTIFNECAVIFRNADGETEQRRPDRVMTDGKRTLVVDFKFGKPQTEHRRQVESYMQLLAQMGYADPEGFLWYVNEHRIEPIHLTK